MTLPALSVKQPWAWLIVRGYKDIENRTWRTKYRGPLLIHAGLQVDNEMHRLMIQWSMGVCMDSTYFMGYNERPDLLKLAKEYSEDLDICAGGVVGKTEIMDCVDSHESKWFEGPYGFVLRDSSPLPFFPCRGKLGIFQIDMPGCQL